MHHQQPLVTGEGVPTSHRPIDAMGERREAARFGGGGTAGLGVGGFRG
jgi:hypothetical protein